MADQLPGRTTPRFGRNSYPGKGALSVADGVLSITTEGDGKTNMAGYLHMGKPEWQNAQASKMEMRLRVVRQIPGTLYAGNLRARSDKKAFGIFFSADKVALGSQGAPGSDSIAIDATQFHVYRVTLAADGVRLYVDGGEKPALVMNPEKGLQRPLVEFGVFATSTKFPVNGIGGTVEWDYIRWTQEGTIPGGGAAGATAAKKPAESAKATPAPPGKPSAAPAPSENAGEAKQYGYEGDRLPDRGKPRFVRNSYPGKAVLKLADGVLSVTTEGDGQANQAGYINMMQPEWQNKRESTVEIRLRVARQIPGTLYAGNLRARSNGTAFGIFFSADKVALGTQGDPGKDSAAVDATAFHVYKITLAPGAVKLYIDSGSEPALAAKPQYDSTRPLIEFGAFGPGGHPIAKGIGGTVEWDYIRWSQTGASEMNAKRPAAPVEVKITDEKLAAAVKKVESLLAIADPLERAAAAVETAKQLLKDGHPMLGTQVLRRIRAYAPDYAPAMEMLGYARCGERWVSKASAPLWESGKVKRSLRVMTFNLLRDLRRHPMWLWKKRQHLVAGIINDYQPDLIGIQEIVDPMLDPLMPEIPGYTLLKMPCTPELRQGSYAGEFIYRTDRFDVVDQDYYLFPPYDPVTGVLMEGGKRMVRRGGMFVKLRDKETGKIVCAFSSHVAHSSPPMNLASCQLIKDRLLKLPEDALIFVMGDFNRSRGTDSWKVLTEGDRALVDSKVLAMQRSISGNGNDGIDWLIFSPKEMPLLFYAVIRYIDGPFRASDHDAVFGEFGLE